MHAGQPTLYSTWPATYFDGRTPVRHAVTVTVLETGLRITAQGGAVHWWPYSEIREGQGRFAGGPVHLERGRDPAEMLVFADSRIVTAMRQAAARFGVRFVPRVSRARRALLVALAAIGAVALAAALYLWGIPAFADAVAARLPVPWEEELGEAVAAEITTAARVCTGTAQRAALDQIVTRLSAAAPHPYTFRVSVVAVPEVNAVAAPGGYIVLFDGLIEKTRSPEELAGALAHEMQHVLQRHGTRTLVRRLSLGALIALVSGDIRGLRSILEAAGTLGVLRYSRDAEAGADRSAVTMLRQAKIDPRAMITFFEAVHGERAEPRAVTYLSTHPDPAGRLAELRRLVGRDPVAAVPLLPGYRWTEMAGICD